MDTISEDYQVQQKLLHVNPRYGSASLHFSPLMVDILEKTGYRSVSDYGAGKQRLGEQLRKSIRNLEYFPYDPAFPEYGPPKSASLVACIDVLEHIEPDRLDAVLSELAEITTHLGFFSIHTGPAKKTLSDGRNAHLIQQRTTWWLEKLMQKFDILTVNPVKRGVWVLVQKKGIENLSSLVVMESSSKTIVGRFSRWVRRLAKPL